MSGQKTLFVYLFIATTLFGYNAQSRTFKNAYISFEMQDNWKCNLEQTEWVCRAEDPQEAKEAVIILTAKEKGPTDSFPQYTAHLNSSINTVTRTGVALTSTMKYKAREQKINDQNWLDSLHQDSEVQNYFTRYVATIKDEIAILVTFSAHNRFYAKHSANFEKTIQSLRVIASKDLLKGPDMGILRGKDGPIGLGITDSMPMDILAAGSDEALGAGGKGGLFRNKTVLGAGLLILGILIYIIAKVMNKKR